MMPDAEHLRVLREMRDEFTEDGPLLPQWTDDIDQVAALTAAIERWERLAGLREKIEAIVGDGELLSHLWSAAIVEAHVARDRTDDVKVFAELLCDAVLALMPETPKGEKE